MILLLRYSDNTSIYWYIHLCLTYYITCIFFLLVKFSRPNVTSWGLHILNSANGHLVMSHFQASLRVFAPLDWREGRRSNWMSVGSSPLLSLPLPLPLQSILSLNLFILAANFYVCTGRPWLSEEIDFLPSYIRFDLANISYKSVTYLPTYMAWKTATSSFLGGIPSEWSFERTSWSEWEPKKGSERLCSRNQCRNYRAEGMKTNQENMP